MHVGTRWVSLSWDAVFDPQRQVLVWLLVSFVVTALATRWVTRRIRAGRTTPATDGDAKGGPIGDIHIGGVHVHHQVWGIAIVLLVGLLLLTFRPDGNALTALALAFGCGAALALDEFAMWLHVEDVYWSTEGRKSITALMTAAAICLVLLLGTVPLGLDGASRRTATVVAATVLINLVFVVVSILKGKLPSALIGVFLPVAAFVGALRLAKPGSWWFRMRYADGGAKAHASLARYDAAYDARLRRLHDLIGGAPDE